MLAWTNKKIKRLLINLINEVCVNTNHKSYKIGKPVRRIIINFHNVLANTAEWAIQPSTRSTRGGTGSYQPVVRRKLTVKSIETKYQAIIAVEKGEMTKAVIAKQFQIPANTLSTWIKLADKIKTAYLQSSFNTDRKRMRTAKSEETERTIFKWFTTAREQNIPVSGPMLLTKVEECCTTRWHRLQT